MSWFDETAEDRREIARERLLIRATEQINQALEDRGVTRAEMARRLGVAPSEITMRLRGTRNLTLATISDMLDALGYDVEVHRSDRRAEHRGWHGSRTYAGPPVRYTATGVKLYAMGPAA